MPSPQTRYHYEYYQQRWDDPDVVNRQAGSTHALVERGVLDAASPEAAGEALYRRHNADARPLGLCVASMSWLDIIRLLPAAGTAPPPANDPGWAAYQVDHLGFTLLPAWAPPSLAELRGLGNLCLGFARALDMAPAELQATVTAADAAALERVLRRVHARLDQARYRAAGLLPAPASPARRRGGRRRDR